MVLKGGGGGGAAKRRGPGLPLPRYWEVGGWVALNFLRFSLLLYEFPFYFLLHFCCTTLLVLPAVAYSLRERERERGEREYCPGGQALL